MENIETIQAKSEAGMNVKEYDALVKEEARKLAEWADKQVFEKIYGKAESYKT